MLEHRLHLNVLGFGARPRLGLGVTAGLHCGGLGLQFEEVLSRPLCGDFILELLPLQHTLGLLPLALSVVPCGLLLALGGDLNSLLNAVGKGLSRALINGFDALDVDVGDDKLVVGEDEFLLHFSVLALAEHSESDNVGRVLVEIIKRRRRNSTAYARSDCLARITHKVWHLEDLGGVFRVAPVHLKVPVIRQLNLQPRVITCLDHNHIRHEIRPQRQGQRVDLVLFLGLPAGKRQNSELLVGLKHNQTRPPHHTRGLGPVVVDLNSRVVRGTVRHDPGAIARDRHEIEVFVKLDALAVVLGKGKKPLHVVRKRLLPQLLVGAKEIGPSNHRLYRACLNVANIHPLGLVQRDSAVPLHHLNLHRGDILSRPNHRPAVSWGPLHIARVREGLCGLEEESLIGSKHDDVFGLPIHKLLTRLEEEGNLSPAELEPPHLLLSVLVPRVTHCAVLVAAESTDGEVSIDDLLMNILNVRLALMDRQQPLLSGAALGAVFIGEGAKSTHVDGPTSSEDQREDRFLNHLVAPWEVSAGCTHKPLLSSTSQGASRVRHLLPRTDAKSGAGLHDGSTDGVENGNLNPRDVRRRSHEEPLIASHPLDPPLPPIHTIADG
mmetsp:Transcript_20794/g.40403  ORF Transcript_20794/g.40403 Transcript_20794/m.40403 type:complete len:608 (-) Transcript_20794:603-2426(-)